MKKIWCYSALAVLLVFSVIGCKSEGELKTEDVSDSLQSSVEAVADGFDGLGDAVAMQKPVMIPAKMKQQNLLEKGYDLLQRMLGNDQAFGTNCLGSGTIDVTGPNWGSATAVMTRTFNDCTGPFGGVKITGSSQLNFAGLKSTPAYVEMGSTIERTVNNLRFTRTLSGHYMAVSGGLANNATHKVTVLSFNGDINNNTRNVKMDINVTRSGHSADGSTRYSHNVMTENSLNINSTFSNNTLTLRSVTGKIIVSDSNSGSRLVTHYNNVTWDHDKCLPLAGTAEYEVQKGEVNATGSLTFSSNGLANFTFTVDDETQSGTVQLNGCY